MGGFSLLDIANERRNTLSSDNEATARKFRNRNNNANRTNDDAVVNKLVNIVTTIPTEKKVPKVKLNNGQEMPIFGLGTCDRSAKDGEVTRAIMDAIDCGYRHFDCAWNYMNEDEIGAGIKAKINEGVIKREDVFIVSKLWNTFHRPDLVEVGLRQSLKKLQVDYLDLYLIHFPTAFEGTGHPTERYPKDHNGKVKYAKIDICDTWKAMEDLVHKGLVKSIGVSNFNSNQIERILTRATIPPVINQVEIHPYFNNRKLVEFCQARGINVTAYSPLNSPHRLKEGEPTLLKDPVLVEISQKYGKSVAQVILRWVVQRGIALVPKSVSKKRMLENIDVFDFHLDEEDMEAIFSLNRNFRLNNFLEQAAGHPEYPFDIEF